MDFKGFHTIDGIRYCRITHWDGHDYMIPWVADDKPPYEVVRASINDWWKRKEDSVVKRFS